MNAENMKIKWITNISKNCYSISMILKYHWCQRDPRVQPDVLKTKIQMYENYIDKKLI